MLARRAIFSCCARGTVPSCTSQQLLHAMLTCDSGSIAELELGGRAGVAAGVWATSVLLPAVPLPVVPAMAVVWEAAWPASSASASLLSLSLSLPLSFSSTVLVLLRDSRAGLLVLGLREWVCGVGEAGLRVFASSASICKLTVAVWLGSGCSAVRCDTVSTEYAYATGPTGHEHAVACRHLVPSHHVDQQGRVN